MRLILHLATKDLQRYWPLLTATVALPFLILGFRPLRTSVTAAILQNAYELLILATVALVVLAEPPAGSDAMWRTRPIPPGRLLSAKSGLLGLILLSSLTVHLAFFTRLGLDGGSLLSAGIEVLLRQGALMATALALASMARSFPQWLGLFALYTVAKSFLPLMLRSVFLRPEGQGVWQSPLRDSLERSRQTVDLVLILLVENQDQESSDGGPGRAPLPADAPGPLARRLREANYLGILHVQTYRYRVLGRLPPRPGAVPPTGAGQVRFLGLEPDPAAFRLEMITLPLLFVESSEWARYLRVLVHCPEEELVIPMGPAGNAERYVVLPAGMRLEIMEESYPGHLDALPESCALLLVRTLPQGRYRVPIEIPGSRLAEAIHRPEG